MLEAFHWHRSLPCCSIALRSAQKGPAAGFGMTGDGKVMLNAQGDEKRRHRRQHTARYKKRLLQACVGKMFKAFLWRKSNLQYGNETHWPILRKKNTFHSKKGSPNPVKPIRLPQSTSASFERSDRAILIEVEHAIPFTTAMLLLSADMVLPFWFAQSFARDTLPIVTVHSLPFADMERLAHRATFWHVPHPCCVLMSSCGKVATSSSFIGCIDIRVILWGTMATELTDTL